MATATKETTMKFQKNLIQILVRHGMTYHEATMMVTILLEAEADTQHEFSKRLYLTIKNAEKT